MRMMTNKDIEKRAIWELIDYFETQIDLVIKQSVIELNKLNELKEIQGLDTKSRIDKYCVRNAINTINSDDYSSVSEGTGGALKREGKFEKPFAKFECSHGGFKINEWKDTREVLATSPWEIP